MFTCIQDRVQRSCGQGTQLQARTTLRRPARWAGWPRATRAGVLAFPSPRQLPVLLQGSHADFSAYTRISRLLCRLLTSNGQ